MNNEIILKKKLYKYNLSFYYQATIIYFGIFAFYVFVRGNFEENLFKVFTDDPIIYFFLLIILISLIALIINVFRDRYLEVNENGIIFYSRFKEKKIKSEDIEAIKIYNTLRASKRNLAGSIKIKLKGRKRVLLLRSSNYENTAMLLKSFEELKKKIEKK